MSKLLNKDSFFLVCLIVLSLGVYHTWFFNSDIITSGDWGYIYKEPLTTLTIHWFSLWLGDFYGRVLFDIGQAPTYALFGFFAKFFSLDYSVSERIIYLWPIAFFTSLLSYFLLRFLSLRPIAAFVGALVYGYNTYFIIIQNGHLTLMGAFCLAPLVLLMYIKTLQTLKIVYAVITGLLLAFAFAYEPRGTYIIVWILLFYAIYHFFLYKRNVSKKIIFSTIFIAAVPIIILGLLNVYWIGAFLQTQATGVENVLGRSLFGNEFSDLSYSLTLFQAFWTGKEVATFQPQQIPLYFWLIPVIAFLGLFLNRKNTSIVFFGFVALLGIFFSKQVAQPLGDVYPWLYTHLPGFNAFREASKFLFLVALGYSVLIAAFIDWLWQHWTKTTIKRYGTYLITIVVAGMFLWNSKPFITGEIKALSVGRQIPSDYLIVKNFIQKQPEYFRTFWVPQPSRYTFYSSAQPLADWSLFSELIIQEYSYKNINFQFTPGQEKIFFMKKPFSNSVFDLLSVKYIFVPLQDTVNDDNFFLNYWEDRDYYINELDNLSYLYKIDTGTKQIVVYENKNFRPHFYLTNEKENLGKENSFQMVKSVFIKPTHYELMLKQVKNPVYLTFSEKYHPDWRLRLGEFNWTDAVLKKNYFLPNSLHGKNDVTFNTFFIDPKAICLDNDCVKHPDGSYDINLTLYFKPQSYLYFGEIFSGSVFFVLVGFLFVRLLKNYVKK